MPAKVKLNELIYYSVYQITNENLIDTSERHRLTHIFKALYCWGLWFIFLKHRFASDQKMREDGLFCCWK